MVDPRWSMSSLLWHDVRSVPFCLRVSAFFPT
jgi:hypothetical protein